MEELLAPFVRIDCFFGGGESVQLVATMPVGVGRPH
jgi:hypothetical protein